MPKRLIYLAGPDVFLPDAKAVGRAKAQLCAERGYEGVFPLDADLSLGGTSKHVQAHRIQDACEAMMRRCDLCLANCTPFRGVSMDSGTAFEVGFMRALGKSVFGYSADVDDYAMRTQRARAQGHIAALSDPSESEIENFDRAENLMIAVATERSGLAIVRHPETGSPALAAMAAFRLALARLP